MNQWTNKNSQWTNGWTNGWTNRLIDKSMDQWTNIKQTSGWWDVTYDPQIQVYDTLRQPPRV